MKEANKKALFLITKSNFGGAQRYVRDLAVGLPKDQFDVVVALGQSGPLEAKLREAGIRVLSLPSLQRDISIQKEWRAYQEISEMIKAERPDIFHINSSKAGALGALAGRLHGVPNIIFTAHGWAFNEDRPYWQKLVLKFIHYVTVLLSHHTIAVSIEVLKQMDWPGAARKITVIYNGREVENLMAKDEARAALIEREPRLSTYPDDLWTMTIAELHPIKRHEAVIETIGEIAKTHPNLRHLIIGAGQEEKYLRDLIDVLGLEDHVFMLGNVNEAARYLKAADIFILASRSEALPYVVLEACSAGVPTIATRVGGIPEIIENEKSGLLIPPLDNRALENAIKRLILDENLRASLQNGAKERSEQFRFDKTLTETIALYLS